MNNMTLDSARMSTVQNTAVAGDMNQHEQAATGVNLNDAAQTYAPLKLDSEKVISAEKLAFDLTASANSATQMAHLFLELVQSLREAAENRAQIIIQQMETQVEVKRETADVILSNAQDAKDKGDKAVEQQRIAAYTNIAGAAFGFGLGAGVGAKVGTQGGAAVSSLMTTGSGGGAGLASAQSADYSNEITEIQEKSKAEQTDNDAEAQQAATLQQRANHWEGALNDLQQAFLSLAKELFSQEPTTARNIGNNI